MKRMKNLIFGLLISVIGIGCVNAASISVTSSSNNVAVGNTFTVTVTVNNTGSSSGKVGAWEYCIDYDSSKLSLTSGNACVLDGAVGLTSPTKTFKFKAIASGTSTISLKSTLLYDFVTEASLSVSKGAVTIKARTQQEIEASYSDNANLKDLRVDGYEISPSFDKDTLEYDLEVENDVFEVDIKATKADSGASVSGAGNKTLTEGMNSFKIVVTAEKGNKKTYVVNINRKELNPITVDVGSKTYNIVRKAENLEVPTYYSSTTIEIDDEEIPAFKSDITGYTLVGLKDEEGNIKLFSYKDGKYEEYKQIGSESFVFISEKVDNEIKGYGNKTEITINDIKIDAYTKEEGESEFLLVYGMNASNGSKGWYRYDTKEGTFQRYLLEEENKTSVGNEYFYLTIVFAGGLGLALIIIIVLLVMISKKEKKNKKLVDWVENKINKTDDNLEKEQKEVKNEEVEEPGKDEEVVQEENIEEQQEEPLSKRELRRLEKEKQKKDEEELKAMQEDFLATTENTILSDTDIIEEVNSLNSSEETEDLEDKPKKKTKKKGKGKKSK